MMTHWSVVKLSMTFPYCVGSPVQPAAMPFRSRIEKAWPASKITARIERREQNEKPPPFRRGERRRLLHSPEGICFTSP